LVYDFAVDENFVADVDVGASLDFGKKKKKKPKAKDGGGANVEGDETGGEGPVGEEKGPNDDILGLELDDLSLVGDALN
jgi:hypothetical protein